MNPDMNSSDANNPGNTSPGRPNIVLTGFMATGKSTVGPMVADRTQMTFVDCDSELVKRHGPIQEIFIHRGEDGFRELEVQLATETGR